MLCKLTVQWWVEGGRRRPRRLRRTVQYDCHVNRVRIRNVGMLRDVIVVLYFYYYCGEIKKVNGNGHARRRPAQRAVARNNAAIFLVPSKYQCIMIRVKMYRRCGSVIVYRCVYTSSSQADRRRLASRFERTTTSYESWHRLTLISF